MTVTLLELAGFALAFFLLVASPGPFVAALAARSAALGLRSGVAMALGASLAEVVWIASALLGLGAIAATHAWALVVLKYIGAAWLIWIGIGLLTSRQSLVKAEAYCGRGEPLWRAFAAGALIGIGNPKAALFYMAVFPGFFDMTALTLWDALAIAAVALPIGLGSDLTYAWAAARTGRFLSSRRAARRIDQVSGGALAGAGAAIAAS
ncbi:MAG: LysE family translocator [Pseudomonadota bacterium]